MKLNKNMETNKRFEALLVSVFLFKLRSFGKRNVPHC